MNIVSCSVLGTLLFELDAKLEFLRKHCYIHQSDWQTNNSTAQAGTYIQTYIHTYVHTYILFVLLGWSLLFFYCIEKFWWTCGGTILSRQFPEGTKNKRNTSIRTSSRRPIFELGTYRMWIRRIHHMLCESWCTYCISGWRLFEVFLDMMPCREVYTSYRHSGGTCGLHLYVISCIPIYTSSYAGRIEFSTWCCLLLRKYMRFVIFSIFKILLCRVTFSYPFKNTYQLKGRFEMLYGQYLPINKVQCQRHEFFEQYHNDIQPATLYVEFRYQFCTGLSDSQPNMNLLCSWGNLIILCQNCCCTDQNTLFHETLTFRTPFPVRKPFYRTEESNSA
jgi:hypothetical protein